jgi:hypothetical protein
MKSLATTHYHASKLVTSWVLTSLTVILPPTPNLNLDICPLCLTLTSQTPYLNIPPPIHNDS